MHRSTTTQGDSAIRFPSVVIEFFDLYKADKKDLTFSLGFDLANQANNTVRSPINTKEILSHSV